jgi:hypothetical protein
MKFIISNNRQAYPVMGVIVFACAFSGGACLYFIATHPDARVSKTKRTAVLRGELLKEELELREKH